MHYNGNLRPASGRPSMRVAQPIQWTREGVVMLDQRRLPTEVIHHTYTDYR